MSSVYDLVLSAPSAGNYVQLRSDCGLSPRTQEQAAAALPGSWFACHVLHTPTARVVGMGRLLGDGGWYFHVVDMAVLPAHQRRGLGNAVLGALLSEVRARAPAGAIVTLFAEPPGVGLYQRYGFTATAPGAVAMALRMEGAPVP